MRVARVRCGGARDVKIWRKAKEAIQVMVRIRMQVQPSLKVRSDTLTILDQKLKVARRKSRMTK